MNFWTQAIDIYCERTAPGLWGEPWNALSNVGFLIAGFVGLKAWKKGGGKWLCLASLFVLLTFVGSVLFHTFANQWSHFADLLPILLFMLTAVAFSFRAVLKFTVPATVAITAGFLALTLAGEFGPFHNLLNGSGVYLPTLALLGTLGAGLTVKQSPHARHYVGGFAVFAVSLTARTLDAPLCASFPHGTHFIWHLLNGTLLAILLRAMATQPSAASASTRRR